MKSCIDNIKVGDRIIVPFKEENGVVHIGDSPNSKEFPVIDTISNAITIGSYDRYPAFSSKTSHISSINYELPYYFDIPFNFLSKYLLKIIKK